MTDSLLFLRFTSKKKKMSFAPELVTLITVLVSAIFWNHSLHTIVGAILFMIWSVIVLFLCSLAVVNLKTMLLPNTLTKPLIVIVIAFQIVNAIQQGSGAVLWSALLGGLLLGGIPYLIFQLSAGRWIGGGDVKLGFAAGLLLGWKLSLLCIGLMIVLVALSFLLTHLASKMTDNPSASRMETGVLWAPAIIACVLFGHHFVR
jgi:leader peptidase (prepilin peptidase)/N-methyltransferase